MKILEVEEEVKILEEEGEKFPWVAYQFGLFLVYYTYLWEMVDFYF